MPPKRRTAAKSAPAPKAAPAPAPNPPKPTPPPAKAAAPPPPPPTKAAVPPPPPPPPPPVEIPSAKVRKEWHNFIATWYEPEKKKLTDQIMKELDMKFKKTTSRAQQAARQVEKEKRLSDVASQLAEPAHAEWENRLAISHLQADDWTDITDQEQQFVLSVFVGLFGDDEDEEAEDESNQLEESIASGVEEPHFVDASPFFAVRQSPPTPVTGTFELVNPSSFFTDTVSPRNQPKKLPELAMDNLTALNNLNTARNQFDAGTSTSAVLGFQGWASEAGLAVPSSASIQQPNGRHRATDNVSRQASGASSASSPPLFSSGTGPHYSPLEPMSKISPLVVAQNLLPGKRYIGPVIADEEAEPIDEDLLKAKMAADFLEFKMDVRIRMIQQFHAKASAIEIELVKQLDSDGSRENRLRTMQEHEQNMMSLRESKEIERKRLCDEERDRRLQEHKFFKQVAAHKADQARWNTTASSSKTPVNKPTVQNGWTTQSAPKLASQKENLSTGSQPTTAPKPDHPSILKKSNSAHSRDPILSGFDEAAFLRTQAEAASLAKGKQPLPTAFNLPKRPSALKKAEDISSQDEPSELVVPPHVVQPSAVPKGKKGKKGPVVIQQTKTVTFNEEPEIDAEPPPQFFAPSASGTKGVKGAKVSLSSKPSKSVMIEEEPDEDADPSFSVWSTKVPRNTTSASASAKKAKVAVVSEVAEADPSPPAPPAFGWGSTASRGSAAAKKGKAPIVPPEPAEDSFSSWGAKSGVRGSASTKKTKVVVTEEPDEEAGPSPLFTPTWGVRPKTTASSSKQAKKITPELEPRRSAQPSSKHPWAPTVQDADEEEDEGEDDEEDDDEGGGGDEEEDEEDEWNEKQAALSMPGGMDAGGEDGVDQWGGSYWGNLSKGQPVAQAVEESAKHMLWTPTADAEESGDEDSGGMDESMEGALWMQYAISGGNIPGFEIDDQQELTPPCSTATRSNADNSHASIWEQGKGKKKSAPVSETSKIEAARIQHASASTGNRTGQWQKTKMENWASRLGQSSGSARHL